ncbi:hypothetical protein M3Y98_00002200 [Aphelenchoides besseyi]|nr:hypothetical protein M3Y98_00002200 [Aphelenchoides besseyi]
MNSANTHEHVFGGVFMFISTTMSQEFDATTTELLCALIKSQAATTAPHGLPVCVRFLYNLHRDFQIPRLVKVLDFSCREKLGSQLQSYGVVKFLEQHIDPTLVTIYEGMLVLTKSLKSSRKPCN